MDLAAQQRNFADALLTGSPVPLGLTTARGEQDAARFAVYRNNVFVGLTRALAQRFPVTERLVGTEFFVGMARAYAQSRRPSSPLLFTYGNDFPDFVAEFPPAAGLPYLSDVARLEASWTDAYHAADETPLGPTGLPPMTPDALEQTRLRRHPSATIIPSSHPVGSIWSAHQGSVLGRVADWSAETVLVVRPGMQVGMHVLPPQDAGFAVLLFGGASLGSAAHASIGITGFDFGRALVGLLSLGAFSSIQGD